MKRRWYEETKTLGRFAGWLLAAITVGLLLYVLALVVRMNVSLWGAILGG